MLRLFLDAAICAVLFRRNNRITANAGVLLPRAIISSSISFHAGNDIILDAIHFGFFADKEEIVKDIVWSHVLSVEVDEIDEDHRKLVNTFNTLNHAVDEGQSPEYLAAILEELINCTVWHFSHEERLMLKYEYDEAEEHKEIHKALIDAAKELQKKIVATEEPIDDDDIEFLEHWLTEHILTADMRLGSFLAEVM